MIDIIYIYHNLHIDILCFVFDSLSCEYCIEVVVVYIGTVQYVCFVIDKVTCLTV